MSDHATFALHGCTGREQVGGSLRLRRSPGGTLPALSVCTFLLLALGSAARAGEDPFEFFRQEATVVAATKHSQRLADVPASAYVITAEEIERFGYRTLGEALQSVPGFYVTDDRNYSYLWVRGFGRPGDYNSRVLLLVDGHRVNDNIYGASAMGHDFSLDLRSVARVEVIKGPGSALHGDDAFFAVVNVVPRNAADPGASRAAAGLASYGTRHEFLSLARVAGPWALYASGSYRRMLGQDLLYPEFADVNGGWARNADREGSYTGFASVARGGWLLHANGASRSKRIPTGSFGTRFSDPGTETTDSRSFVELRTDRQLCRGVILLGRAYYDRYRYRGIYVYDSPSSPPDGMVNDDFGEARWYGEEVRLRYELPAGRGALLLGQEYERNLRGLQTNADLDPYQLYFINDYRPYRWAFFAQQELQPHPRVSLTLGARYDRYQSFGRTLNPRTAAVCRLWRGSTLKLLYGSAFRAPTPFEMFYVSTDEGPNPNLQPEKVRSHEIHLEQRLPGRATLSAGFFHNRIRSLISQVLTPDSILVYENLESVRSQGLELGCSWRQGRYFSGRLGYVLQDTRNDGSRLSNSPQHSGIAGLLAHLPWYGTTLGLESSFVGRRHTLRGTRLSATAVVSLQLVVRPPARGLMLTAGARNLTDTDYRVPGAGEHLQDAIRQDGRSYTFGLEYRLGTDATRR